LKKFIFCLDVVNSFLVVLNLSLDVCESLSMNLDQTKILTGDFLIEVLHISESSLVVSHEVIDMLILPLFNLVNLNLQSEFKLFLEVSLFLLVLLDQLLLLDLESLTDVIELLVQVSLLSLNEIDVSEI